MGSHHSSIVRHRKSYARLSKNAETTTCIVFVHGFFGDVVTTWEDFPDACDNSEVARQDLWARSDLYFFDYGAEKDFVKRSAAELGSFISHIFPRPKMEMFSLSEDDALRIRNPWQPYSRLLLIGHSLGAVVIRECIENQFRGSSRSTAPAWVGKCELRLFAAAHRGFQFSTWKELAWRLFPKFVTAFPVIWRAFSDLQKNSTALSDLRTRTENLATTNPDLQCFRALLLYGSKEDVVTPGEFDSDYEIQWLDGHDHTSVCKPDSMFVGPLDFVTRDVISRSARS